MEINSASLTVGDAIRQTAAPANNADFAGSFAYLLAGAGGLGIPDTRVGRFTADGNGGWSGGLQGGKKKSHTFSVASWNPSSMKVAVGINSLGREPVSSTVSEPL